MYKIAGMAKPGIEEKEIKELQINEDLVEAFELYDLNDLDTINELTEGIEQINELGKVYRHIHVELEMAMGEKNHSEHYNNYPKVIEQIRTFLKNARTKIKTLRLREKEIDEEKRVLDKLSEEEKVLKAKKESEGKMRDSLRIEEQVFQDKLRSEIENFEFEEINEIQETCNKFHILLEEYYNLLSRVKIAFTDDYENEFKVVFETTIAKIRDQIKEGKLKIRELNSVIEANVSQGKTLKEKEAHDNFIKEQKFHAGFVSREVEMRCTALCIKCDPSELENMSDYQILEQHKNMSAIDRESTNEIP